MRSSQFFVKFGGYMQAIFQLPNKRENQTFIDLPYSLEKFFIFHGHCFRKLFVPQTGFLKFKISFPTGDIKPFHPTSLEKDQWHVIG